MRQMFGLDIPGGVPGAVLGGVPGGGVPGGGVPGGGVPGGGVPGDVLKCAGRLRCFLHAGCTVMCCLRLQ